MEWQITFDDKRLSLHNTPYQDATNQLRLRYQLECQPVAMILDMRRGYFQ